MEPPIPSTTGAALLKCSLGRCWAWGGSVVPSWHRFWSPSSSEWWQETSDYLHSSKTPKRPTTPTPSPQWDVHSPQKKYVKHLTRLTKAQLHSTFDPGRPDIGWWPWPKHQGQASHFPNPEGAFFQKLWPWLIHFSLLIHVLISVVLQPPTKHRPNHQIFHWNFMHFAHTNKSPPLGAPDFCHCGLPVSKWLNTTSALPIQKKTYSSFKSICSPFGNLILNYCHLLLPSIFCPPNPWLQTSGPCSPCSTWKPVGPSR